MAVIEYDSYKQKLLAMDETFENLFKALEIEQARQELNRLELEAHELTKLAGAVAGADHRAAVGRERAAGPRHRRVRLLRQLLALAAGRVDAPQVALVDRHHVDHQQLLVVR